MTFNRNNFITMNGSRLFTAKEVADLIREYDGDVYTERTKVLDDLCNLFKWMNKNGNFRPWNIGHIEEVISTYRKTVQEKK